MSEIKLDPVQIKYREFIKFWKEWRLKNDKVL